MMFLNVPEVGVDVWVGVGHVEVGEVVGEEGEEEGDKENVGWEEGEILLSVRVL